MSVPVPGTPPRRTDALRGEQGGGLNARASHQQPWLSLAFLVRPCSAVLTHRLQPRPPAAADRLPSDALPAVGAIAPAAALQHAAPAEPAVPQPITPPPVATASSLPSEATPLLAPVAEEAEADSSAAAPPTAAAPPEAAPATPAQPAPQQAAPQPSPPPPQPAEHPVIDAALMRAIARSDAPYGPPSLAGAVEDWEADQAARTGRERGAGATFGARPAGIVCPPPARRLEDLRVSFAGALCCGDECRGAVVMSAGACRPFQPVGRHSPSEAASSCHVGQPPPASSTPGCNQWPAPV